MPYHTYPYELPPLPFDYDALEPYIDAETMHYHHDKHFKTYVDELNKTLAQYPRLQKLTLPELLSQKSLPVKILNNAGGVYNHTLYFSGLSPAGCACHQPSGEMLRLIEETFESFENFKEIFMSLAKDVFGSGWTVLFLTPQGQLKIANLKNQDTLLPMNYFPILYVDVWEHAYYLKYKNERVKYLENIWNVLDFPMLEQTGKSIR